MTDRAMPIAVREGLDAVEGVEAVPVPDLVRVTGPARRHPPARAGSKLQLARWWQGAVAPPVA